MPYVAKSIYHTLQGEGANAGRAAVFLRFAGCNLWTGREADRATATCRFCDTDFIGTDGPGGGRFANPADLAAAVAAAWPARDAPRHRRGPRPLVVCTGGEPLLQLDVPAIDALHARGFEIAVETNGTVEPPPGLDWICVSPKADATTIVRRGDELKLVFPQEDAPPEAFAGWDFAHFFLQPMDGPSAQENTLLAIEYCRTHPQWRLSVQTHKVIGIP